MLWLLFALIAAIIWGLDYALGEKIFNAKISPTTLLAVEMFIGSIFFFIASFSNKNLTSDISAMLNDKILMTIVIAAILTFNLGNYFIFLSIQAKNATLAGVIELSYPLFTLLFSWLLFRVNHFTLTTIVGGITIFIGVLFISLYDQS